MTKKTLFSPEVRQRAVRMVLESQGEYDSQWAAICSIAPKTGCTPETCLLYTSSSCNIRSEGHRDMLLQALSDGKLYRILLPEVHPA